MAAVNNPINCRLFSKLLVSGCADQGESAQVPAPVKAWVEVIKAAGGSDSNGGGYQRNLFSWFHGFPFYSFVGARSLT